MTTEMRDTREHPKRAIRQNYLRKNLSNQSSYCVSDIPPEAPTQRSASDSNKTQMQTTKIITSQAKPEEGTSKIHQQQIGNTNTVLAKEPGSMQRLSGQDGMIPPHGVQSPVNHNPQEVLYNVRIDQLSQQLKLLYREKKEVELERNNLRLKVQDISADLTACRDTLFSLQPQEQTSDHSLNAEWEALCQEIARWVDDEIETDGTLKQTLLKLQEKDGFHGIVAQYWRKDRQISALRVSGGFEDLVKLNIHQLLEQRVFNNTSCLVGLTHEQSRFLQTIEARLAKIEPPRDLQSIAFWRSETLNAAASAPDFEKRQEEFAQKVTHEAEQMIKPLFPKLRTGAIARLHTQITLPAISLTNSLRRSISRYYFAYDSDPRAKSTVRPPLIFAENKVRPLYKSDISKYSLQDISSRKNLKADQEVRMSKDGMIGEQIMILHPALRREAESGSDVPLGKPTILIKLLHPLPRRGEQNILTARTGRASVGL